MSWQTVKLGDFLKVRDNRFKPKDETIARLKRIEKIDFSGNIFLSEKPSNTDMILVKKGDLVISGINVEKGAMSVYQGDEDIIATIHYSSYEFDTNKIDIEFLKFFLKSAEFRSALKEQVPGGIKTEIKPKHLLPLLVDIPTDINEQKQIVSDLQSKFKRVNALSTEQEIQLTYLRKLRQQILSDAMQGKLDVPHSVGENGSDLLFRIQTEKAKTVKKAKPLPEIKADDIPFAIPEHWVWCRLGEVVEMSRGKFSIRPRNDPRYFNGIYPFIQIGSLDEKGSVIYEASQSLNEEGKRVSKEFPKGTIVIAIVGGTIGNLGVLGIDMCFTDSMVGIYPSELYNQEYVLNFLRYVQPEIKKAAYQMAGQPNIKIPTLTELIFPLPPLSEQAAIVHKIDSLMTHCDELEASIRKNQEYTQMLYQTSLREALQQPAK